MFLMQGVWVQNTISQVWVSLNGSFGRMSAFWSDGHGLDALQGHTLDLSKLILAALSLAGFIHVMEMSGRFNCFQAQGIVRKICDVLGKNEILQKGQGNVREFYISTSLS